MIGDKMVILVDESWWVECQRCHLAYVVRRRQTWESTWVWVWQPDCKCKPIHPVVSDPQLAGDAE